MLVVLTFVKMFYKIINGVINMSIELNGKIVARKREDDLKLRLDRVKERLGFTPVLATILVGDNASSITYVNMKTRASERIGLRSRSITLSMDTTTSELIEVIDMLNSDREVVGILLQHPVPKHIDERLAFDRIAVEKDVDGVNSLSFGRMSMGRESYLSATPRGIISLLKAYDIPLVGKEAVVVGRSAILGKPIAMLLLNENCTVTICHSRTENLKDIVAKADIIVGAVGKPKFIEADWIKDGAVVIDAGYNTGNVGDIDVDGVKDRVFAYTPVPGGVGPMTIDSLLTQAVESAEKL